MYSLGFTVSKHSRLYRNYSVYSGILHYYPNSKSILHSLNNLDFTYLSSFFFILLSLRYKYIPKLYLNLGYQPSFLFIINGTILRTIYLTQIYFVCSAIWLTHIVFIRMYTFLLSEGRRHKTVNYTGTQSFTITFSYSLAKML